MPLYEPREAQAIVRTLLCDGHGLTLADVLTGALDSLSPDSSALLETQMQRLERAEPVQQVLGFAWFCGRRYRVMPDVLTPRPETEELCRWIIDDMTWPQSPVVADIGTGSGCIACTLALDLPGADVTAIDISAAALNVARTNAATLGARLHLLQADVLASGAHGQHGATHVPSGATARSQYKPDVLQPGTCHIVVSNPPYITLSERAAMHPNVTDHEPHQALHEPHLALFVPDDDPLLFYRAIARRARTWLRPGGWLFFEINPLHAATLAELLSSLGYTDTLLRHDTHGRLRMARAQLS